MAEIASVIAVFIALAALYLGNLAHRQVDTTFENFAQHVAKQVHASQRDLAAQHEQLKIEFRKLKSGHDAAEAKNSDQSEKIYLLTQRISVLEHDLKSLTEAIPPQFRRPPPNRASNSVS